MDVAKALSLQSEKLLDESLVLAPESKAIPFKKVVEAIDWMRLNPEPKNQILPTLVMFELLFLSGMRVSELDNCRICLLFGDVLYWKLGKNQKGMRKVKLPLWYLQDLKEYRESCRVYGDQLFGIDRNTMRHYFNNYVRPNLSKEWKQKTLCFNEEGFLQKQYVYGLKGARKNYQTLLFNKKYRQYGDAHFAVLMTAKEMQHKSERITAAHYICNFESLKIDKLSKLEPSSLLRSDGEQKHLVDYGFPAHSINARPG